MVFWNFSLIRIGAGRYRYDMELHMVHQSEAGTLAVVGVMYEMVPNGAMVRICAYFRLVLDSSCALLLAHFRSNVAQTPGNIAMMLISLLAVVGVVLKLSSYLSRDREGEQKKQENAKGPSQQRQADRRSARDASPASTKSMKSG